MESMKRLAKHLKARPSALKQKRDAGVKCIGHIPGDYFPEELAYASKAIPIGLIRGGDYEAMRASGGYLPRFIDAYSRAQIGYRVLQDEPLYQMIDLLVVPVVDRNIGAMASAWEFFTDVEVFKLGIPHARTDHGYAYYLEGIELLKERIERLTGTPIVDENLREQIQIYNEMRDALKRISELRKAAQPPISGKDFVWLNHASYYADMREFAGILEALYEEAKEVEREAKGPRIMLTGSTLAMGDNKLLDLIEGTGASIVIEEFAEGLRSYRENVKADGDLARALADRYFRRRIPGAFARPATRERFDFLFGLAKEFKVDGIIWYNMMYRDSYNTEGFYFAEVSRREIGVPVLKLETDYDPVEVGPLRTRVETFMETVR